MSVSTNPFLTATYSHVWLSHFHDGKPVFDFGFIRDLKFTKKIGKPLYVNCCGRDSKAMSYRLVEDGGQQHRRKVFLIYDVPSHVPTPEGPGPLRLKKSRQYPGFLCNLEEHQGLDQYMAAHLSGKTRNKFRRYRRKLEQDFAISYHTHTGPMEREAFDLLFNSFHELLLKRFEQKKTVNNNLFDHEWRFYREAAFAMLGENQAALSVVYDKERPIAFSLLLLKGSHAYDTLRTFDIDYAKYRLGTVSIMALLDWCFENGIKKLDFAKGYFPYKAQWANEAYHYDYHILYDPHSAYCRLWANYLNTCYSLKQWLRDRQVNELFHRFSYGLKKILAIATP